MILLIEEVYKIVNTAEFDNAAKATVTTPLAMLVVIRTMF
jgi:hypothetical protein